MGRTVAVTGVNSYFAQTLLPRLEADPDIDRVVGMDVSPWRHEGRYNKVEFRKADVRDPEMEELLQGVDTLYHLAFIVQEIHDKDEIEDVNVNGSRNVFEAAAKNGVRKVVYTSSITAYGAHPDNPLGLTEESPLRGNSDSYYSSSKVKVEQFVRDYFRDREDIVLTVFRVALVVGPNMNNFFSDFWTRRASIFPGGRQPHLQLLHEDDLGEVLHLAHQKDLPGVYNVAARDALSARWVFDTAGVRLVCLPSGFLKAAANVAFALRLEKISQGWLSLSEYTIFVSCDKIREVSGWEPSHTSEQAFMDFLTSRGRAIVRTAA
ncbi:MAG: NAD-dependent epimerase/dehydratase family protein [Desulfatibacillaceae bacterium]